MVQDKSKQPDITILMSVYNETTDAIIVAVESILNQTYTNFEFIIVNDNPTDARIKKTLDILSKRDQRIQILTNNRNRGLGYSLNEAIKISRSKLIARMDTEDSSMQDRLTKQISFLNSHPEVDLLFTQWIDVNEKGEKTLRSPKRKDFANIKEMFFKKSLLMHPSLAAKKKVMLDNPYPEMERPEDLVLWLKLIRQNYIFDVIEEPLYSYQVDRLNIEKRYGKIRKYSENLIPHLMRESQHYWRNFYFWIYFARILFEYLVSRNLYVFKVMHHASVRIWRLVYK